VGGPADPSARRRASALFARGRSGAEAARLLGVSRTTGARWRRLWLAGGAGALLAARPRGRRARLDGAQAARVERALLRGPRAMGFDLDRWSLAAVAALVERETGVRHHRRHVGRLLRRLGWVVPPLGPRAGDALRKRAARDSEGNAILLFERCVAGRPRTRGRGGIPRG